MSIVSLPRHRTKAYPDEAAIPVASASSVPARAGSYVPSEFWDSDPVERQLGYSDIEPAEPMRPGDQPRGPRKAAPSDWLPQLTLQGAIIKAITTLTGEVYDEIQLAIVLLAGVISDAAVAPGGPQALAAMLAEAAV